MAPLFHIVVTMIFNCKIYSPFNVSKGRGIITLECKALVKRTFPQPRSMPICSLLFLTALAIVQHPNNWADNEIRKQCAGELERVLQRKAWIGCKYPALSFASSQTKSRMPYAMIFLSLLDCEAACIFPFLIDIPRYRLTILQRS